VIDVGVNVVKTLVDANLIASKYWVCVLSNEISKLLSKVVTSIVVLLKCIFDSLTSWSGYVSSDVVSRILLSSLNVVNKLTNVDIIVLESQGTVVLLETLTINLEVVVSSKGDAVIYGIVKLTVVIKSEISDELSFCLKNGVEKISKVENQFTESILILVSNCLDDGLSLISEASISKIEEFSSVPDSVLGYSGIQLLLICAWVIGVVEISVATAVTLVVIVVV
jgi:hypothetical protein